MIESYSTNTRFTYLQRDAAGWLIPRVSRRCLCAVPDSPTFQVEVDCSVQITRMRIQNMLRDVPAYGMRFGVSCMIHVNLSSTCMTLDRQHTEERWSAHQRFRGPARAPLLPRGLARN